MFAFSSNVKTLKCWKHKCKHEVCNSTSSWWKGFFFPGQCENVLLYCKIKVIKVMNSCFCIPHFQACYLPVVLDLCEFRNVLVKILHILLQHVQLAAHALLPSLNDLCNAAHMSCWVYACNDMYISIFFTHC